MRNTQKKHSITAAVLGHDTHVEKSAILSLYNVMAHHLTPRKTVAQTTNLHANDNITKE